MKKKVLVNYQIPREGLEELFKRFDVYYPQDKMAFTPEEVNGFLPEIDAYLAVAVSVNGETIKNAPKLKIISNYGVGYDNIDVQAATKNNVVVANITDSTTEATAEIAFGLMLAVMRKISQLDRRLRLEKNLSWSILSFKGNTLMGKTLGIIGMGRIGKAVARRAQASGMKVIYYKRNRLPEEEEKQLDIAYMDFEKLLEVSDVISVHTPLTGSSRHMIGRRELDRMKRSVYIVNTARGAVFDEEELIKALEEGRIAGAGLDVFENEPHIPEKLLTLDNVVLTPHIGTEAIESRTLMAQDASRNIVEYFDGIMPKTVLNPELYKEGKHVKL